MNLFQGIVYENTGDDTRARVYGWHQGTAPRDLSKTSHSVDVAGLPSKARRDIITYDGEHTSRFKVGFEIEKNRLHRGAIKEYPLLKGYEYDGSCGTTSRSKGFEAITNILPLLPAGKWRNKVFNMFVQAEKIIEDKYSPSNARCGGHMTLSVDGFTGYEVQQKIRKYSGIMYALYRHRLSNTYCNGDVFMDAENRVGASYAKYCITRVGSGVVEFRLPSRITGVKQLMRRYELAYEMLSYAFNTNGTYAKFIEKVRPIIVSMYDGDAEKAEEIIQLSFHMQRAIDRKKINVEVREWFEPNGRHRFSAEHREYEY